MAGDRIAVIAVMAGNWIAMTGDWIAAAVDNVVCSAIIIAYGAAAWAIAARALSLRLRAVSSQLAALVVLPVKQGDDANDDEHESVQIKIRHNTCHGLHPLSAIVVTKTDRGLSRPPVSGSEVILAWKILTCQEYNNNGVCFQGTG